MNEVTLYDGAGTPSPRRVRLCLIEKGIPFQIKWMNLGLMDQKNPSYLKLNPTGLVPTLIHDGKTIYESNVINEYIEAVFPQPPLVPKDPWGQAQMRMWFAFENDFAKPFRDAAYETMGKERLKSTGITRKSYARKFRAAHLTRYTSKLPHRCLRRPAMTSSSRIDSSLCRKRCSKWRIVFPMAGHGSAVTSSPWLILRSGRGLTCFQSLE